MTGLLPVYMIPQPLVDVPFYIIIMPNNHDSQQATPPSCPMCDYHACAACNSTYKSIGSLCSKCGTVEKSPSCDSCRVEFCRTHYGAHAWSPTEEPSNTRDECSRTRSSSEENEASEDATETKERSYNQRPDLKFKQESGQSDIADVEEGNKVHDLYDQVHQAWNIGQTIQVKHNTCITVEHVAERKSVTDLLDYFQRLCDKIAWDIPNGIVCLNLDDKKSLVFHPGHKQINSVEIDAGLSWAKHNKALTIALRMSCEKVSLAILDVTWILGQTSRIHFFRRVFLMAMHSLNA
eukprot:12431452-Karenia_brevis.AAC.5